MDNIHDRFCNTALLTGVIFHSSELNADALQTSQRESRERPLPSGAIDPGPAGFDWSELETMRAGSWRSRLSDQLDSEANNDVSEDRSRTLPAALS